MGILQHEQYQPFIDLLLEAYPDPNDFDLMLFTRLGKNRAALANTNSYQNNLFIVIQKLDGFGWTYRLINAILGSRPDNPEVIQFAQQFNLTSIPKTTPLQRIIQENNSFLNLAPWLAAAGQAEMRVCQVEIGTVPQGTGFLVGPSAVMTNYHVIKPVLQNKATPEKIVLRFDYKKLADGTTLNEGTEYKLEESGWHIASSPYSAADLNKAPVGTLPGAEELDFALLRVKGTPAKDRVGRVMEPLASPRGHFDIPNPAININPGELILILQHPQKQPLKLAMGTDSGANANNTRVRYTTNTLPGSSGSPCFNINWQLVALHHAGDPNYDGFHKPQYNQGIPIDRIQAYLAKQGKVAPNW
jgi:hypothetical protein